MLLEESSIGKDPESSTSIQMMSKTQDKDNIDYTMSKLSFSF